MWGSFLGYMPEFELENMGLSTADPSAVHYQMLAAETPFAGGEPSNPAATGTQPI